MSTVSWTSRGGKAVSVEVLAGKMLVTVDGTKLGESRTVMEARHAKGVVELLAKANCSHCILVGSVPVGLPAEVAAGLFAARDAAEAAAEAHRYRNLPGVAELREATGEAAAYRRACDRLIANDLIGRSPRPPRHNLDALRARYPSAAAYLRAEGYAEASNHHKAAAGERAMRLLEDGGSVEAAERVLADWLPTSAWTD